MKFNINKYNYLSLAVAILITFLTMKSVSAAGISLSPPKVELEPGGSFQLTIKNTNPEIFSATLIPALFQKIEGTRSVRPLTNDESKEFNLSENLKFSANSVNVESGKEVVIEVNYLKGIPDYFVGVIVQQTSSTNSEVGVGASLASFIVDYTAKEDESETLITGLINIYPSKRLLGFSLEGEYTIEITINNNSSIKVKPTGEVTILGVENNKKLEQFSITGDIIDDFEPGASKSILRKINNLDLDDIKNLKAVLRVSAENNTFELSDTTQVGSSSSFPLIIIILIVLLLIVLYIFFLKRKSKSPKRKNIKPVQTIYSTQTDIFNRRR